MRLCVDSDGCISAPLRVVCEGFVDSVSIFHTSLEVRYKDYRGTVKSRYQYPHDMLQPLSWYRDHGVDCYE